MATTHRVIQLSELADKASSQRARYYCNAISATTISNRGAAAHFTQRAQQWERIRIAATRLLLRSAA